MFESSRRGFLKVTGGLCAGLFGAKLLTPNTANAQAGKPAAAAPALISEADPLAKSLGYHENVKKIDLKKWPKRAGIAGSKQYCYNCQFYQANNDPTVPKAPCTIFAGKGVLNKAWCNSWTQNPKVTS